MSAPPSARRARAGYSLVEAIVGIVILVFGVLALAAASSRGLAEMSRGRLDVQYAADLEQVADSLLAQGWGHVVTGSTSVRGRAVAWTVATSGPTTQTVTLSVTRANDQTFAMTQQDTVILVLAKPTGGS